MPTQEKTAQVSAAFGIAAPADASIADGIAQVAGAEPTPEFAAEFADECARLLERLGDADLVRVVLLKLEGFSSEEIGQRLGRTARSIQRKLETIRAIWEAAAGDDA